MVPTASSRPGMASPCPLLNDILDLKWENLIKNVTCLNGFKIYSHE